MSTAKAATPGAKAPVAKKSVSAEIVMGKAAIDLNKAVAEAMKATEGLGTLVSQSEDLTLTISNQEAQIEELDIQFAEKERQLQLDLELKMKGSAEKTVQEYLASNKQRSISLQEYQEMTEKIAGAEALLTKTVTAETAKVRNEETARFNNEKKLLEAQHAATEAKNNASISVMEEKVKFLEQQNENLLDQINQERQASIERAKAGSIGNINLGGTNGGR